MSQTTDVIEFIREHGSITQRQASRIGCDRLSARIHEMRKFGINIQQEMVSVKKSNGKKTRIARYTIPGGVPECFKA